MILSLARPPHIIFNTNDHQLTMNFPEIKIMIITEKQFMIIRGSFTAIHVKKTQSNGTAHTSKNARRRGGLVQPEN